MPAERTIQRRWKLWVDAIVFLVAVAAAVRYAPLLAGPSGTDPNHPLIRESALPAIWLWPWGAAIFLAGRDGRRLHTLASGLCLLHVAVAFHLGHAWSHRAAYEHTEAVSGYGAGIFVNYLFVAVWMCDVVWGWVAFDSYLKRPRWMTGLVLGFMGFVIVNAAVIFARDPIRWLNLFLLLFPWTMIWLGGRWVKARRLLPFD